MFCPADTCVQNALEITECLASHIKLNIDALQLYANNCSEEN